MACLFHMGKFDTRIAMDMLAAIERILPTEPLIYRVTITGKRHVVDDPAAWCASKFRTNTPEFICNGNEQDLVSFGTVTVPGILVPGGRPLIQADVGFPWIPRYIARVPDLVAAVGPAAHAHWGIATPSEAGAALAEGAGRISPNPGQAIPSPPSVLIPHLGWVSYWSSDTCQYLGFSPDDARASLFHRVETTEDHGVAWQLTEDLLDPERPEHLFALERVYKAFPEIDSKWGL